MYHIFTIGDIAISMVWLGILIFICIVTFIIRRKTSKFAALSFDKFFIHLPFIVLWSYLAWSWFWYVINQLVLIPTSFEQLFLYLSPTWRNFSLLWIIIWALLWFWSFLSKQPYHHRSLRVDVFFEAVCIGVIPLGVFLVLGDSFIWIPTDWILWVSAIQADSKLALYNSVLPIWFGLSLAGMIGYGIMVLWRNSWNPWYWYLWFAMLSIVLAWLTLYQNYARRVITVIGEVRLDIKQYILLAISVYLMIVRYRSKRVLR